MHEHKQTHSHPSLKNLLIDRDQATTQLEALSHSLNNAYLRAFLPKEDPRYGSNTARKADRINWKEIESWQAQGYGIHIVVNGGGHKDEDVQTCRAIFMEHDDLEIEVQRTLWQTLELPEPTLQVQTRKSVHSYWVIEGGCDVSDWKPLQADLLAYAQADPALKNPSRMMRLAGAYHIKPGHEPIRCNIIHNSGKRYGYSELRTAVPVQEPPTHLPQHSRWRQVEQGTSPDSATQTNGAHTQTVYQHYEEIIIPVREAVPLEVCLSKESRALLTEGAKEGGRNTSGAKVARDLIGTANYLTAIGQQFNGAPEQLLEEYANRCVPPLPVKEVEAIWKSAQKDNPSPSCQAEGVETCIRAWYWNNHVKQNQTTWKNNNYPSSRGFGRSNSNSGARGNTPSIGSISLAERISEILKRHEAESEIATALMELASATGRTYNEINSLAKIIRSEGDLATEVIEAVKSFQGTLKSCRKRLNIRQYIEPGLSEPLLAAAAAMPTAPEYLFNTVLATTASRIGTSARVVINPEGGYAQPCVFWTANVAHSGQAKTPPQQIILKPLEEMESNAKLLHDLAMADYEQQKNSDSPPPVRMRRILNNVTTSTKIRIHEENPRGLVEYLDELVADYQRLNQYKSGKGDDLQLELSFWNGAGGNYDRQDARLFLGRTALSKTGTYQWDTLARLMNDDVNFIASGYSARFLYCSILDAPARYLDLLSPRNADTLKDKLQWLYGELERLPEADYLLSHEAKVLFQGWNHTLVNAETEEVHFGLTLIYAKIESYTARIALWLHIVNATLRGEKPSPVISGQTMQNAIEIASFYLWQQKLIHAHNSPTRSLEGILLKVQTQAEKFFTKCGKGVNASFLKTRINSLKTWVVEKIRNSIFKSLAAAGHGRIEGEGSEMTYIPNTVPAVDECELVGVGGVGGELRTPPIPQPHTNTDLQSSIGEIGEIVDSTSTPNQPVEAVTSFPNHQFTNSTAEITEQQELDPVGDTTNPIPIPPTMPQQQLTAPELAALILQCSTWVELVEGIGENSSSLMTGAKIMPQEQRPRLTDLLATHLCQNPDYLGKLSWIPVKLRDKALERLTFTIRQIGGVTGSVVDACIEYVSGCKFVSLTHPGTRQETWTFQTSEGVNIPVFGVEEITAIVYRE
ncbi:MAG: DUF3987 domain-containing protein [Gloeocapsa sp. UFS-A4-WI-NPMV-4B04]|jgi:hypothetical protein|nr:DUF3987 domain-containing protein [Gloeocapsa sp. UFS-A4-WI-NPMV-4B04]